MFTPRIHQLVQDNKDDKARLRTVLTELFVRVGRIQFLILSLVCTGIIFFGKPFIYFWAGPGYDDAYIIVLLLIIPGTASSLYKQSWICLIVWALLGVVFWFTQKKEYLAEPAANTKK